jgi:uroporphyrinogen-III synthase
MALPSQVTPQAMANNAQNPIATLLMTRDSADAARFVAALDPEALKRTQVIVSPLLRIAAVGDRPDLTGTAGVILTSAKAVGFAPPGAGRPAYCVGLRTAEAAGAAGWDVRQIAETAEHLLEEISADGPLVHLAGRHQRGDIAQRLTARGLSCRREVIYDQHLLPLTEEARHLLQGDVPVIVPLFSPRTARQFADQAPDVRMARVLAISAATAAALGTLDPAQVQIATAPTADQMRLGVEKLLRQATLP